MSAVDVRVGFELPLSYLGSGWLVPRSRPDALLHDPTEAAERVLRSFDEPVGSGPVHLAMSAGKVTS